VTVLENRELTVLDPRTGEVAGRVPIASPARCDEAVASARRAAPGWARTPAAERGAALRAAAAAVRAAADELAALNARETGKPVEDARGGVDAGIGALVQYAELGPVHRGRSPHGACDDDTDLMVPEPRGVVAVLTPWNDPVAVAAGLIGAALATGNTVVHKPSERCPQTGRRFAELVAAHVPPGVLEIVDGDAAVGAQLAESPVDVVAHVGSSATGRAVAEVCARTGAHALLENGGNDPLIVDAGVEPEWAAAQAALGAFASAGQIGGSVGRIYLLAPEADAFLAALTAQAQQWAEGIGPLVDRGHRRHVHGHVEGALDVGAHALTGGTIPDGPGAFYPPTVLIGCVPDMAVVSEETFGPVAPVRVVPDFTTALREASADRDGLAATVLTPDMAHAQAAWQELPVGHVKINDVFSGSGSGFGPELLDEMSVVKVVHLAPASRPS